MALGLGKDRILLSKKLAACDYCPRRCGADRTAGETGFCGVGRYAVVSSAYPHFGEERVLVGAGGSGAIFLAGCNLGCSFCQNRDISHGQGEKLGTGKEITEEELAKLMIGLQAQGCSNVNLVTPSHVALQAAGAIRIAVKSGLEIPIVYNTSAYDSVDTLRSLEGLIDIYMPDFKFWSEQASRTFMNAEDYPRTARLAIEEMHRQVGDLVTDQNDIAVRGLLVRHLVMPGMKADAERIMGYLSGLSKDTFINVMSQYRPFGPARRHPDIGRRPEDEEVAAVKRAARDAGLHRFAD
ncbi:MAG: radical SAM protein [Deltaproteobacteria bacterium]|nr:radical SAM protein [Deltaproteobacteria bacterium]